MLICPGCKAILKQVPADGACPKCAHPLREAGTATDGPHAPTLEVTAELGQGPQSAPTGRPYPDRTVNPDAKPDQRSVQIAPRRLSRQSIENITNTWQGAMSSDATPRSSLKLEGQSAVGMGSSLVVNLRGLRTVDDKQRRSAAGTGADYELLQVIGKGGMGVVYSARQASVDRMVAVKMIRDRVAADPERREKFLSEAVVTGDLDHPNIVPIYELGADENNALFYSMKRVQGTPWSHVIGTRSLGENLEILMKVADAVAFAHANGVVHRDLKPENVMLGDFGEVLVMDWGLALATATFRHPEFVSGPESMGGTPAYMAPEMVTGPFDVIGPPCDIYLLGGILYEIATGLRPHHGKTAQECLLAAARNEIQATDKGGELVDIAYRAMATQPTDRYASVQEFQAAIRAYHSHMESIALSNRADTELAQAKKSGDYQSFSRALFGFEEALTMWTGNTRARAGASETRLAYATSAKTKGDFELGMSLLDSASPEHAPLHRELAKAQLENSTRQKWLSRFKRIAAAMAVLIVGIITISLVIMYSLRNEALAERDRAEKNAVEAKRQEKIAVRNANEATRQQKIAETNAEEAKRQQGIAEKNAVEAKRQQGIAEDNAEEANKQRKIADDRTDEALKARAGEEQAAYGARIGMAAAKIEENSFDAARSLLDACPEKLRDWEWGYLKRLSEAGRNFRAEGTVHSVAFAPHGKWFVTAGEDQKARIWDPNTDRELRAIETSANLRAASVSPDGTLLATSGDDPVIRIFQADDGREVLALAGHTDQVLDLAFSASGKWLISASADKTARIWDLATGREITGSPLRGHYAAVHSAEFSPDEKQIVTAGEDGRVVVWPTSIAVLSGESEELRKHLKEFLGHDGAVYSAAFSPDGQQVVSGGYDKRVLIWYPAAVTKVEMRQLVALHSPLAQQKSRSLEGHTAPIRSVSFSPDGQYVISGSDDNTVHVWDATTGRPHAQLRGHSRPVLSCAISADGQHVVSAGHEGEIKLWPLVNYKQAPHGKALIGHDDAVLAAGFSPDGSSIITASNDRTAAVFHSASAELARRLHEGHEFLATRAIYFAHGKRLLTAGGDNTTRVWDAARGTELFSLDRTGRNATVAVSSDGRLILTGNGRSDQPRSEDFMPRKQLLLWQVDDEARSAKPLELADDAFGMGHGSMVTTVAISLDGRLLFSGDDGGIGKLWDGATGKLVHTLRGHTRGISAATFLADGRLLTAGRDGIVLGWNTDTGRESGLILKHGNNEHRDAYDTPVVAIAVSPRGEIATLWEDTVSGKLNCMINLWNVAAEPKPRELFRGTDLLTSLDFSADGANLYAAGSPARDEGAELPGGMVRAWSLASGAEITGPNGGPLVDLRSTRESIWAAVAAPEGGVLTVGGTGATLWQDGKSRMEFKPHDSVTAVGFSPSGQRAVTASRRAKIWNVEQGLSELQLPTRHDLITSAQFSPADENLLVTAGIDGTAVLWDLAKREPLREFVQQPPDRERVEVFAVFSPDGKSLLTGGGSDRLRMWNVADGMQTAEWLAGGRAQSAAFSHDGARIIVGMFGGQAVIFDAQSSKPLLRCEGHTDAVNSVAFSPDGSRALTGSRDRLIKLWDTAVSSADQATANKRVPSGKELLTLRYHDQGVTSVSFAPDGRSVLSASLDGTAVLWQTDTWQAAAAN